jgi:hypothetical protein
MEGMGGLVVQLARLRPAGLVAARIRRCGPVSVCPKVDGAHDSASVRSRRARRRAPAVPQPAGVLARRRGRQVGHRVRRAHALDEPVLHRPDRHPRMVSTLTRHQCLSVLQWHSGANPGS